MPIDTSTRESIVRALRAYADRIESGNLAPTYLVELDDSQLETAVTPDEARKIAAERLTDFDGQWPEDVDGIKWSVVVPIERAKAIRVWRAREGEYDYMAQYELRSVHDATAPVVEVTSCPECGHEEACPPGGTCSECGRKDPGCVP